MNVGEWTRYSAGINHVVGLTPCISEDGREGHLRLFENGMRMLICSQPTSQLSSPGSVNHFQGFNQPGKPGDVHSQWSQASLLKQWSEGYCTCTCLAIFWSVGL